MNDQRQIVAFMAFAVAFAVVGNTIKLSKSSSPVNGEDAKILLGGAAGTVLLVLLSEAGQGGESFAKGLAVLTMVSSVLINGSPVFAAITRLTGKTTATNPAPQLVTTQKAG